MSIIVKPNTFSAGATIVASEHNDNFDTLFNDYNGNINNANIKANAAIDDTKLAQITTADKVHGTSLTGLASISTAVGTIPTTNIPNIDLAASGTGGVTGTLAIGNGGTGATIASDAANAILPAQTGSSGTYLTTNATNVSWKTPAIAYSTGFGNWAAATVNTATQATTDGIIVGWIDNASEEYNMTIKTDSSNPPTTVRVTLRTVTAAVTDASFCCPVKKDDYYLITETTGTVNAFWMPIS